jgi:hypothetical protein
MAKVDLEMALVKAQGRSPLSVNEMLELLGIDIGTLLAEHDMDLYQAEEIMMWRKHEALRWHHQLVSFPAQEPMKESKKLSIKSLNRLIISESQTAGPPMDGRHAIALGGDYGKPPSNPDPKLALAAAKEMGYDLSIPPFVDSNNIAINDALAGYPGEFTFQDIIAAVEASGGVV